MTPILVVFSFLCCLRLIVVAAAPLHWTGLSSTVVGGERREKTGCGGLVGLSLSFFVSSTLTGHHRLHYRPASIMRMRSIFHNIL